MSSSRSHACASRGRTRTAQKPNATHSHGMTSIMTTLTSVLGLVPMAIATGEGAELRAPLAITVAFGLTVSTLLTLVVIPAVYLLVPSKIEVEAPAADEGPVAGAPLPEPA